MTKTATLPDTQVERTPRGRGRPVEKPIPDTLEKIAEAIMQGSPKRMWRYLDGEPE